MAKFEATKYATKIIDSSDFFRIDFSKKDLTNKVLKVSSAHQGLQFWLRHPLLKAPLDVIWQPRAAKAVNTLSNSQLNEEVLLSVFQNTQRLSERLREKEENNVVKPLMSTKWLLDLHQSLLRNSALKEAPRQMRGAGQKPCYLNRLSGVAFNTGNADLPFMLKQWREWANSENVLQCAAEYRAVLLLYYLQLMHPFGQGQTALSFTMFYGLLKSAGFSQVADGIITYYAENIESLASCFAAATNSAHLKKHQQVWFDFFMDAWFWSVNAVKASINTVLLSSHYRASLQHYFEHGELNERQYTVILQLLANEELRDKKRLFATSWYRSLYKKLTTRTQERDFKALCELGFVVMKDRNGFELTVTPRP